MALKPLKPCRHPGCRSLTREGYCPKHKPKKAPRRTSAEYHSWYSLPVWTDDLRPAQLLREPFCRECARAPKHPEGLLLSASIFLAFFGHFPGRFLVVVVLA